MKGVLVVSDFAVTPAPSRVDVERFRYQLATELADRCEQLLPEIGRVSARVAIAAAERLAPRASEFLTWTPGGYDPITHELRGGRWSISWPAVSREVRAEYAALVADACAPVER